MISHTYWTRRWDVHQVEKDTSQDVKLGDAEMKIMMLERMVSYLVIRLYRNQPIDLKDRVVREFLNLSNVRHDEESLDAILSHLVDPLGLLTCHDCGAKIKDVPGVLDEKCHWCGGYVGSER